MDEEKMLTVPEVAARVRANEDTVRRWLRTGRLKGILLGGRKLGYRIPEGELERFLRGEGPEGKGKAAA